MKDTLKANLSIEEYEICKKLKDMRFSAMAGALQSVFGDPNADLLPFLNKIQQIVEAEWDARINKKFKKFLDKATLKYEKADLDQTLYDPERQINTQIVEELAKCEWINQRKNLVITGKSSSGKSYLANALCICALRQFKAVRYIKASQLIGELTKAEKLENYQEVLNQFASFELLVVDDFGLMDLDIDKCRNLFEVFDSRDPFKSTLVISQVPVASWYDIFHEHTYAEACLTRLLGDCYRLEMNGKNMRNMEPLSI